MNATAKWGLVENKLSEYILRSSYTSENFSTSICQKIPK